MRISDWSSDVCSSDLWENWLTDVKKARPAAKLDSFIADTAGAVKTAGNDLSKASPDAGPIDKVGSRMAFNRRIAEISGTPADSKPWESNAIPLENWVAANPPETNGSAIAGVPVDQQSTHLNTSNSSPYLK